MVVLNDKATLDSGPVMGVSALLCWIGSISVTAKKNPGRRKKAGCCPTTSWTGLTTPFEELSAK